MSVFKRRTPERVRVLVAVVLAAMAMAASGCATPTWRSLAADLTPDRPTAPNTDVAGSVDDAGLNILLGSDPNQALAQAVRAFESAPTSSVQADRAALMVAVSAQAIDAPEILAKVAEKALKSTADPEIATALLTALNSVWGHLTETGPVPRGLAEALVQITARDEVAWADARDEARRQLVQVAVVSGQENAPKMRRREAGILTRWRVSLPWGTAPDADFSRAFAPDKRALQAREQTGDGIQGRARPTWTQIFSDGEVAFFGMPSQGGIVFAETWIKIEGSAPARVRLHLETNRSVMVHIDASRVLVHDRVRNRGGWIGGVELTLTPGVHRVLLRASSPTASGFMALRITPRAGDTRLSEVDAPQGGAESWAPVAIHAGRPSLVARWGQAVLPAAMLPVGDIDRAIRGLWAAEAALQRPQRDPERSRLWASGVSEALGDSAIARWLVARTWALDGGVPKGVRHANQQSEVNTLPDAWADVAPTRSLLARIAAAESRHEDALALWRAALQANPKSVEAQIGLLAFFMERRWESMALEMAKDLQALVNPGPRPMQEAIDAVRGFGRIPLAQTWMKELIGRYPRAARSRQAAMARDLGDTQGERAALTQALAERPETHSFLRALVRNHLEADDAAGATRLLDRHEAAYPNDIWVLTTKAQIAASEQAPLALDILVERIAKAEPRVLVAERLAAWMDGKAGPMEAGALGGSGLIEPNIEGIPDGYDIVTLKSREVVHVRADGAILRLLHTIRRAGTKAGADRLGELRVPQGARLIALRTLEADGTVTWPERTPGKPDVSFRGLQIGDSVEAAWIVRDRVRPEEGGYLGGLGFVARREPILHKELSVHLADGLDLDVRGHNGAPAPTRGVGPNGFKVYRWTLNALPILAPEPNAVGSRAFTPFTDMRVVATATPSAEIDAASWTAIARWMAGRFRRLTRVGPRAEAIARDLEAPHGTRAALAEAFGLVAERLHHDESFNGFERPAEFALASEKGSRVVVLAAVAEAAGAKVDLWLCAPEVDGPAVDAAAPLPSANRFWYPVLRFTAADGGAWADPSRPYNPFDSLAPALAGARCLIPTIAGGARFANLPTEGISDVVGDPSGWNLEVELFIQPDGSATGFVGVTGLGGSVDGLRQVLARIDDARKSLLWQQWVGSVIPGAQVEDWSISGETDSNGSFSAAIEITVPGLMRRSGDTFEAAGLIAPSWAESLAGVAALGALVELQTRHTPLRVDAHSEILDLVVHGLPGHRWTSGMRNITVKTPLIQAEQTVTIEGELLLVSRVLDRSVGRVAPANYPAFRSELTRYLSDTSRGAALKK